MTRVHFSIHSNVSGGTGHEGFAGERSGVLSALPTRDPSLRAELQALEGETDPALFYQGLLAIGGRLERSNDLESAARFYGAVAGPSLAEGTPRPPWRRAALARLDALQGRGALGPRAEFLLRNFAREASRPDMILGMTAAGLVASSVRLGVLGRLAASPARLWTRGTGAAISASAAAFIPEIGAFWGAARLWNAFASPEPQSWELRGVGREWASLALTLGLLKLGGAASRGLFDRVHGIDPWRGQVTRLPAWTAFSRPLFSQAGTLSGIVLGHWAEGRLGLRPRETDATLWTDSLATLLQFHVGGRLSQAALGSRHAARLRQLDLRTRALESPTPMLGSGPGYPAPALAHAGSAGSTGSAPDRPPPPGPRLVLMSAEGPIAGGRGGLGGGRRSQALFAEWLRGSGEASGPARRTLFFQGEENIFPALERALEGRDPERTSVRVSVEAPFRADWRGRAKRLLEAHPGIEELRMGDAGGEGVWAIRSLLDRAGRVAVFSLNDPTLQSRHRIPAESLEIELRAGWRLPARVELGALLQRARAQARMELTQVVARLRRDPSLAAELAPYRIPSLGARHLRGYENGYRLPVPFPVLRRLAEYYRLDVRELIAASNLTLHPRIEPVYWSTDGYPIYLEGRADLRRIEVFQEAGPEFRRGMGWMLFAARKNPRRYLSPADFAQALGMSENSAAAFETQRRAPSLAAVETLARTLDLPVTDLVHALNRSFFPKYRLDALFPGQALTLEPRSLDGRKVEGYLTRPGSLGQILFAARKRLPGSPSVELWSQTHGRDPGYLHEREFNRLGIQASNLSDWVWLFGQLDLPLDLLKALALEQARIPANSPAFLMAEAQVGRSRQAVAEGSGLSAATLTSLARLDHVPQAGTIAALQASLGELDGARLYVRGRPRIAEFFPEASGREPCLLLSEDQIRRAIRLHLGAELFALRHDPPARAGLEPGSRGSVDMGSVAERLGLSKQTISAYESIFMRVQNEEVLGRMADLLGLDRRVLYLHYHPEILDIFPVRDPAAALRPPPHAGDSRGFLREAGRVFDRFNLRRKLTGELSRLAPVTDAAGRPDPAAALAAHLGVPLAQGKKYLAENRILNLDDIRLLTGRFPRLSYREWYEHFHFSELAFFLGREEGGRIRFETPEGWDAAPEGGLALEARILEAARRGALTPVERRTVEALVERGRAGVLAYPEILRLAQLSGLDRRLLFFYYRRAELRPILAGGDPR